MGIDKDNYDLQQEIVENVLTFTEIVILQFYWDNDENNACIPVLINKDYYADMENGEIRRAIGKEVREMINKWEKEDYEEWNVDDIVRELEDLGRLRKFVKYTTHEIGI